MSGFEAMFIKLGEQYFLLKDKTPEPQKIFEITDVWVRGDEVTKPSVLWDIDVLYADQILSDFEEAADLVSLRTKYNLTSNGLFKLLRMVDADPWQKIIADYEACGNLKAVACRHGLKPTTISKGLKKRGVEIRKGRNPVKVDREIVEKMLKDGLPINEIAKELGVGWALAKKLEPKKQ